VRFLFDTRVIIDLLLDREPFSLAAGRLVAQVARLAEWCLVHDHRNGHPQPCGQGARS
jgi:hypothetical protein